MSSLTHKEILDKLLANRGAKTSVEKENFLNPNYANLSDPMLLPDIVPALERILKAIKSKEKIYIYGDYDVDGITATTLLLDALSVIGADANYYMPDRFTDGYGLSEAGIETIAEKEGQLIITVDCGSKSYKEIALAASLGIDVIVTDHHSLGESLPDCIAVINPKRKDSKYPFNDLAGVGVAFTLVRALQKKHNLIENGQEKWLLDLVALGTTCDIVSLRDENRILVKWGLEVAKKSRRPAFRALCEVSRVVQSKINTEDFGFRFGPRLNAAGRLETAELSLELMLSQSIDHARRIAEKLNTQNDLRRGMQAKIFSEASQAAESLTESVIVVADEGWSQGVVGIVASKLVEKYLKPTFVLQIVGDVAKGSARSYGDFNLAKAIESVKELIITGGGHALAAGVTISTKDIDEFRTRINGYYKALELGDQSSLLEKTSEIDLPDLESVNLDLVAEIDKLQPFGKDNEPPLFSSEVYIKESRLVGSDHNHLRLIVEDEKGNTMTAIGFGLGEKSDNRLKKANVIFEINKNEFNGQSSAQLLLKNVAKL